MKIIDDFVWPHLVGVTIYRVSYEELYDAFNEGFPFSARLLKDVRDRSIAEHDYFIGMTFDGSPIGYRFIFYTSSCQAPPYDDRPGRREVTCLHCYGATPHEMSIASNVMQYIATASSESLAAALAEEV